LLLVLGLFLGGLLVIHTQPVGASNSPGIPLYLHHLPGNVTVSGVQTSNILNTTTLWDGTVQSPNLRYNVFNFTLYPTLTSSLTSIGPGSIVLWVTVSGAPGSLNATIYDASAAGQLAVVTTSAVISLNSSPTVPYKETLGFNINHTFSQSSTIKLSLTVFKVSQLYVWYDSASYSSALVIPVSNIPTVNRIETFNANFTLATSFSLNWTSSQRIVNVIVHVSDPFGAYHVANANITITGPGSATVFSGMGSSLTTNPAAPSKLFAVSWPYSANLPNGTYAISSTANDTSGDTDANTVNILLTSVPGSPQPSNPPPINPPPSLQPPSGSFPTLYWLIASGLIAALIGALLAFLFLTKKHKISCTKCHAKVDPKLEKCPYCGNILSHTKEPEKQISSQPIQQPTPNAPIIGPSPGQTSVATPAPPLPIQDQTQKPVATENANKSSAT